MCGPPPSRYCVSGRPSGLTIVKCISVGLPGWIPFVGPKPERWYVRAAPTVTEGGDDEPPPQAASVSAAAPSAAAARMRVEPDNGDLLECVPCGT